MIYKFLVFLSLYLPFQLALNPVSGVDLASIRVLILLGFFIWVASGLKSKKIFIKNNIQTALIIVFIFLNIFSVFFARNTDWSIRKIGYLLSIFPIYFIVSSVVKKKQEAGKILKSLVFSGTVVAFLGIVQFSFQFIFGINATYKFWSKYVLSIFLGNSFLEMVLAYPSWLVNLSGRTVFRAISIFPDPHTFSFFLGLLLPIAIGFWFIYKKNIWLIAFFLMLLADLLTFSRGGYMGLLAGLIFLILVSWNKIGKRYKMGVVISVMMFFLLIFIPNPISHRFFSSFNLKEGSNMGRIEMWEKALDIIKQKPFFGVGIGNFPLEVNPLSTYREPIYAHNTYLDISSETGIFSGIVWVGILIISLKKFMKKARKNILALSLAISVIIFSTHSLVDMGIYSPVVLTLFLILISLAYADEEDDIKNS